MTEPDGPIVLDRRRVEAILKLLERMAAGDSAVMLPLTDNRDELDAIAHAINVLSDELRYAGGKLAEAERSRAAAGLKDKTSNHSV